MKRSGPIRRRTPLKAKRVTTQPGDPADPATVQRGLDPAVYAAVVRRDQDCRAKGLLPGPCQGRYDPHHVWRKGQGGPDHEDALVLLCRSHHDWVHGHVARATELGFLSLASAGIEGARAAATKRRASWP